jgi:hypothetical protein
MRRTLVLIASIFFATSSKAQQNNSSVLILKMYVDSISTGDKNLNTGTWIWAPTKPMKGTGATIEWVGDYSSGGYVLYKYKKQIERFDLNRTANTSKNADYKSLSWLITDSHGDRCQFQIKMYGDGKSANTKVEFLAAYPSSIIIYKSLQSSAISQKKQ